MSRGTLGAQASSSPATRRPCSRDPSYKRPLSPSPLRAVVARRYSSKHHHHYVHVTPLAMGRKVVSVFDDGSCCIGGRRELEERRRTDLGLYTRGMRDGSLADIVIDSIIITTGNERR